MAGDPVKYLEWLVRETGTVDVKGLKFGDNKVYQFSIKQYIPLTTSSGHGTIPLEEALQRPRMLIVGDPGAGKST